MVFKKRHSLALLASFFVGLFLALIDSYSINSFAQLLIDLFSRFLKFLSVPIIFLSIVSAICNVDMSPHRMKIFIRIFFYTILTTMIAAMVAMAVYLFVSPVQSLSLQEFENGLNTGDLNKYLMEFMPANILKPFLEGNVFAVVLIALSMGFLSHGLPEKNKEVIREIFDAFFQLMMRYASLIVTILPYVLWAFVLVFVNDIKSGRVESQMYYYVVTIALANLIQACVILPLFLKVKGLSVTKTLRGMLPALVTAFFSKSSSATMPLTLTCLQNNLNVRKDIASFTVPLCTTINMNACAAFIYITVIFVAQSAGVVFSSWDYILWLFLSVLGAIGNAGVPMGCYFISSAFIVSLGAPTYLMSLILPFYLILDMFETAINVWSDACVTLSVSKDIESSGLKT